MYLDREDKEKEVEKWRRYEEGGGKADGKHYLDMWIIPEGWDPNLIHGRFAFFTLKDGKVVFSTYQTFAYGKERPVIAPQRFTLEIAFSAAIAKLFGYTNWDEVIWKKLPHSVDTQWVAQDPPNMDAVTLRTLWIMCDSIESINVGHEQNHPILGVIPVDLFAQTHSLHNFGNPRVVNILGTVDTIKIRICDDLIGSDADIHSDVYLRLEIHDAE